MLPFAFFLPVQKFVFHTKQEHKLEFFENQIAREDI